MPSTAENFPRKYDRTFHQRCLSRARDEPAETPLAPATPTPGLYLWRSVYEWLMQYANNCARHSRFVVYCCGFVRNHFTNILQGYCDSASNPEVILKNMRKWVLWDHKELIMNHNKIQLLAYVMGYFSCWRLEKIWPFRRKYVCSGNAGQWDRRQSVT